MPLFRSTTSLVVVFAALLAGATQPDRVIVHAQAIERALYVSVLNEAGAPVTDLAPSDFIVREDGVRREVLRASRAIDPMHIAVLVDTSQAAETHVAQIRDGLKAFVQRTGQHNEIALIAFGDRPTILVDYTRDLKKLTGGVERIFSQQGSGAYLLEALVEVSRGFRKQEAARPVILLIATEGAEFSNLHYTSVLTPLTESGAALHALVLTSVGGADLSDEARNRSMVLDLGTRQTGGRRDNLLSSMALPGKLNQVADELANQYRVVYARPQALIPPENVEVGVSRPGLTARGTPVNAKAGV